MSKAPSLLLRLAETLYNECRQAGIDTFIDDRDERASVKFKDADLMGFPIRVTAGKKAAEGLLEIKLRATGEMKDLPAGEVLSHIQSLITPDLKASCAIC